ncbi:MAG: GntR family transcriptional regulator [Clostridia bacterium]
MANHTVDGSDRTLLSPIPEQKSLAAHAYQRIKSLVLNSVLDENVRLTEERLSQQLGISKTPVREALKRLEAEGLIRVSSRRGTYVANFDPDTVVEIYDLREILEIGAIQLARGRITRDIVQRLRAIVEEGERYAEAGDVEAYNRLDVVLHDLLVECSDNGRLLAVYRNLVDQIQLVRLRTVRIGKRVKRSSNEHRELVEALAANDLHRAEAVLRQHISSAKVDMLALLAEGSISAAQQRMKG